MHLLRTSRLLLIAGLVAALAASQTPPAHAQDATVTTRATVSADDLAAFPLRHIGPAMPSGRIVDIAVPVQDKRIVYAASASGGLWKSDNAGTTWAPVFERESSISIGAIAIAPSNPNIVWVGTGEANNQRSSSWGDGVYRSNDGGKTWDHMGLRESQHIGGFAIDPDDSNVVYVAALGPLWGAGGERGLFRTTDGGATWDNVLEISENTGIVDVVMDPRDSDLLYAAAYQRERRNWSFLGGGPEGGIYRSTNGGDTWEKLDNGLPDPDIGKIGFAVFPADPDVVYAIIEAQDRSQTGVYVTRDRGASWEHRSTSNPTPWYYSQIRVDPEDADRVYVLGTVMQVSNDGGREFERGNGAPRIHVDHHALWIDPDDGRHMILGNDGGVAITWDRGANWRFVNNLSITQFYQIGVDRREPFYYVCGGTQDNNTWCGPSGTRNSDGIVNDDWYMTVGGDGFYVQADPNDPDIVYSESQYGNIVRFDASTGERKRIQPQPPEGESYRWNWSAPIAISKHDSNTIYFAANKVFRSDNRGDVWEVISGDLSRQLDRDELPMMGTNWPSDAVSRHSGVSDYGNVTTFDESPVRAGLLAAGTDDGLVQISLDDGANWRRIDAFPGVPELTRVSRLMWSFHSERRLYVAFDGHKDNNFAPYLFRSDDHGETWTNITADLPDFGSTRLVIEHPRNPQMLAAGTEFGAFISLDGGASWTQLTELPTVAVHDLVFHPTANDLVIGTHGRGIWILDDINLLEELAGATAEPRIAMVRSVTQFNEYQRGRGSQGATYFRAPNPPRGALLNYYLPPAADTGENTDDVAASPDVSLEIVDSSGARVRSLEAAGEPGVSLEIVDSSGARVRSLEAAGEPGVHRVEWDLRLPPPYAAPEGGGGGFFNNAPRGVRVLPGEYRARLQVGDAVLEQVFEVSVDPLAEATTSGLRARHDLAVEVAALRGTANAAGLQADALQEQLDAVQRVVRELPNAPEALTSLARDVGREVRTVATSLRGGRGFPPDPSVPPGITQLLSRVAGQLDGFTGPPSDTERDVVARAQERLGSAVETLNTITSTRIPELNAALDDAGAAWTPGRLIRQ